MVGNWWLRAVDRGWRGLESPKGKADAAHHASVAGNWPMALADGGFTVHEFFKDPTAPNAESPETGVAISGGTAQACHFPMQSTGRCR